jgi:hypothetical protein
MRARASEISRKWPLLNMAFPPGEITSRLMVCSDPRAGGLAAVRPETEMPTNSMEQAGTVDRNASTPAGHAAVADIERSQFVQVGKAFDARIGDLAALEVQLARMVQIFE